MTDSASDPKSLPVITRLFALLRTMQLGILAMAAFYIGLAELLRRARIADISQSWVIIGGFALVEAVTVIYLKQTKILPAEAMLRVNPEDRAGLEAARKWYVVALAFSAGVSLYGFALRIMGSTFWQAALFYVTGIALTLYCTPRKPE